MCVLHQSSKFSHRYSTHKLLGSCINLLKQYTDCICIRGSQRIKKHIYSIWIIYDMYCEHLKHFGAVQASGRIASQVACINFNSGMFFVPLPISHVHI
jgi:hypothetical protein